MQRDINTLDMIHEAKNRIRFMDSVFCAWDPAEIDVCKSDFIGFSLSAMDLMKVLEEVEKRVDLLVDAYNAQVPT